MRKGSRVEIENLDKSYNLNKVFIKRIIKQTLEIIKKPRNVELEVIFLDNESIRALNKKYKRRDRPTDVLSFRMDLKEFGHKNFLGEIFISPGTAFRNAKIFKTCFEEELVRYMIHGILHLFGYEDERAKDYFRMSKKESEILNRLCERYDLSKVLMPR